MLKKTMTMFLVIFLVNLALIPSVFAGETKLEKEAKHTQKVKTAINKLGVGVDSKVQVKLKDGTKLKGHISEINDEGFTITDANGKSTPVQYNNAKQVKGNNLNGWVVVGIGVGVLLLIVVLTLNQEN